MQPPRNRSKAAGFTLEENMCQCPSIWLKWPQAQNAYDNRYIYLYITIGWSIWSKKVISGSLCEEIQLIWLISSVVVVLLPAVQLRAFTACVFFYFHVTSCPVGKCVCELAAGNAWTRAPVSWPARCDWALYPAGWPEGLTPGRTSGWIYDCPESPASWIQMWIHRKKIAETSYVPSHKNKSY